MNYKVTKETPYTLDKLENRWSAVLFVTGILIIVGFLYIDRGQEISNVIRSTGCLGKVTAILLITLLSMTPIPTESLTIICLKSYGIVWGTFYSWVGSTLSSIAIYWLVQSIKEPLLHSIISQERFNQVNEWIKRKGTIGLVVARLLPLPAFIVNYITAMIPAIDFWSYLWTAALTIIPSYIATALVFMGISANYRIWLLVGSFAMVILWIFSYLMSRYPMAKETF
ncbi:TVP38/TMEM64 family protein [Desulfosporosinus sp. SB140]|uniref:TVP38/TMEM64 family protein n=1 Tax=Desulfosporosinus paludis TaxID=3115649 RepID=UPI00388EC72E